MIKKLDMAIDMDNFYDRKGYVVTVPNGVAVINKINELIDAIHKLQGLEPEKCETLVDPFAEQCKWTGKLCKFWDCDKTNASYGILEAINEYSEHPYIQLRGDVYEHCEPVKLDDDIVYKGE